jgi:prepilin-type N-terminal cleavage/methylation domain-containing protein
MRQSDSRGFTLVEMLLSISVIAVLAGLSLPAYASLQTHTDLSATSQNVAGALRRAQTYARGVSGDSQWGVRVQPDSITVFRGTDYASRNPDFDEVTSIPGSITPSGTSEVVFSRLSGLPPAGGFIVLTANTSAVKTVTFNAKGTVDY